MTQFLGKRPNGTISPIRSGLSRRCPKCGEGRLSRAYLKVAPRCSVCGLDFSDEDAADGPAVFVVLIVGIIVAFSALVVEVKMMPPYWLHALIWLPLTLILVGTLLPVFKGLFIALQFHHGAREVRLGTKDRNDFRDV